MPYCSQPTWKKIIGLTCSFNRKHNVPSDPGNTEVSSINKSHVYLCLILVSEKRNCSVHGQTEREEGLFVERKKTTTAQPTLLL